MNLIFSLLLLSGSLNAIAQAILRTVTDANSGEKINGTTVKLLGFDKGPLTDTEGTFSLERKDTLQISLVGYLSQKIKATGTALSIELMPDVTQLQSVEVVGRVAKDYTSDYSFAATRTATPNKQIPQSISTVTKELMVDCQAFQLADAVKIASGVIPSSHYNQYAIRGISQNEEGQIINGMRPAARRTHLLLRPQSRQQVLGDSERACEGRNRRADGHARHISGAGSGHPHWYHAGRQAGVGH